MLGDPEKRKKYDVLGPNWQQAAQQAEQQRRYRGNAKSRRLSVRHGFGRPERFLGFLRHVLLRMSGGVRARDNARQTTARGRRGQDLETTIELTLRDIFDGGTKAVSLQIEDVCPRCHGTGTENGHLCSQCHGTGHILQNKRFEVAIPRGVGNGQRIRLGGTGRRRN